MKIPFLDLKAQYESIKNDIDEAITSVVDTCYFSGGPFVQSFEKEFAAYCNCNFCIGVGSGTEALWLSLLACGIGPGDEVITVPNTYIATVEAICLTGAKPVFVDIDENTFNMDPEKLVQYLDTSFLKNVDKPNTKAVVPVHLYGHPVDMDPINEIAKERNIIVIEDACQAHGAEYKGRRTGSLGDIGCFSFYPSKNLGAFGEAGAITTSNRKFAERIRSFRDHGQFTRNVHKNFGWNARMDDIQGAILSAKLKYLDKWNDMRRDLAIQYKEGLYLMDELRIPFEADYAKHVYHVYGLRLKRRDYLLEELNRRGVDTRIHYPFPIHHQEAYHFLDDGVSLEIAEKICSEQISLPMYAELPPMHVKEVSRAIHELL